MRKETTLNQIRLCTIARVGRHANFHTKLVGQLLHIMLEPMFKGGWTARDDFVRASPARYLMRHKPVMMRPLFQ